MSLLGDLIRKIQGFSVIIYQFCAIIWWLCTESVACDLSNPVVLKPRITRFTSAALWATNRKSTPMTAINLITRHHTLPIFLTTIDCHMGSTNHAQKAAIEKKIPIVKWITSFCPRLFHLTGQNCGENKKTRSHRLRSIHITIRLLNYNLNTLAIYSDRKNKNVNTWQELTT